MESAAIYWLRFQRRALVILVERWPLLYCARPDVFAVTKKRESIEIEIKRTVSDFRANANKHHIVFRDTMLHKLPHFTYFLVPDTIVEKVNLELPPWAGLMVSQVDGYNMEVKTRAPRNVGAKKLSLNQVCRLGLLMGSQLYTHWPKGPRFPVETDYEI